MRLEAGFSLTEVLVVIFMIAVLAAVASPAFVRMMRDIGLSRATMQMAEMYRRAYVESARRTTLVRWSATPPANGSMLEMRRMRLDDNAAPRLGSPQSCNAVNWNDPQKTQWETAGELNVRSASISDFGSFKLVDDAGTERAFADVCFYRNQAFVRYDQGPFVRTTGVLRLQVKNTQTNALREAMVPPYGLPRISQ